MRKGLVNTSRRSLLIWCRGLWSINNHLPGKGLESRKKGNNIMAMTVEIRGNKLCIEIDLEKPTPSSSGKTLVVASTRGNTVTTAEVDGKPVTIGLNAYIKP